ncbi:glycine betaine ABC transporter substrate-binding protein OsmF [Falsirhodobacter deserti]|uniref:glycine betaine ABC transporter substrate-binding protein OsmF n=1 Tax=Falsirhodobacter deserti TaxID=1365611 RepID=UPI000FE40DAE|nr:ABC transporter substrate-binding protein [Falsirhodobacter deserti]
MFNFRVAALAMMLGAGSAGAQVVVSSKIDTEGGVIGNIIVQVLEQNGIGTQNRLQLGGTPVVRQALLAGEIDLYPEYTGNAAFFFNRAEDPVWKDADAAWQTARDLDEANGLVWLDPAPANNTWGIALRDDVADANRVGTLSDFGEWISGGGAVKLAASSEFVNSAAALPSFQKTYGFQLSTDQMVVLSGGDTAATIQAAANGTSGVNAAMVYGTDGAIPFAGLRVLADDKQVQPVYQPAPVIRAEVLAEYPQIEELLSPVFEALTLETLQTLNGRVQVEGVPAADVARQFLTEGGFIEG